VRAASLAFVLALSGCTAILDAGSLVGDAGGSRDDAGVSDAGVAPSDAGAVDAGAPDGGAPDAGCAIDTDESCGACGRACGELSACQDLGDGYDCVPASCAGVAAQRALDGLALDDGEYRIDPDGPDPEVPPITVWCADLATEPAEYVTVDPDHNYSTSKDDVSCFCDRERRHWSRLRLLIDVGAFRTRFFVDARDIRFTTQVGLLADGTEDPACVTEQPAPCRNFWDPARNPLGNTWTGVLSCAWEDPQADGEYDLAGTPFRFPVNSDARVRVIGASWMPRVLEADLDPARRRLSTRFSAACGGWGLPELDTSDPVVPVPIELAP